MANEKLTMSVAEAAEALGVSPGEVYTMVRQDGFPAFKPKGRILISRKGLEQWVDRMAAGGVKTAE